MPHSALKQAWPVPETLSPEQMALAALRHEIDQVDDDLLALFQKRLSLAARVGLAKDAPTGPHVKLRPRREQAVLDRVLAQSDPHNRDAVEHLWREIVGWGLARQGRMAVQVWSPIEPTRAFDGARLRFGAAADMKSVRDPHEALKWAAEGHGVAVLAVNAGDGWWTRLRREWSSLTVFDGFGGATPTALALGKIDPASMPGGRRVLVEAGGDAGDGGGIRKSRLDTCHGWTLSLTDAPLPVGGPEGCVGAISG